MKILRTLLGVALMALSASAFADDIRWIGWSADESRYGYLLRQPLGETGYTDVYLIVRATATGKQIARYHVRHAQYYIEHPPKEDEDEEMLEFEEAEYVDELYRRGYLKGKPLFFKRPYSKPHNVQGEKIPILTAALPLNGRTVYLTPTFTLSQATLNAGTRLGKPGKPVARAPITPLPFMLGTPDARSFNIPPTHPTEFYLSPSGKWVTSTWHGQASLPDGLSWPAYLFQIPVRALTGMVPAKRSIISSTVGISAGWKSQGLYQVQEAPAAFIRCFCSPQALLHK